MNGDAPLLVVPVRHYRRWFAGFIVLVIVAMTIHTLLSKIPTGQVACHAVAHHGHHTIYRCSEVLNWRFSWDVVGQYITSANILKGLLMTLALTALTMIIGITLGAIVAVLRLSPSRVLAAPAWLFTTEVTAGGITSYGVTAISAVQDRYRQSATAPTGAPPSPSARNSGGVSTPEPSSGSVPGSTGGS